MTRNFAVLWQARFENEWRIQRTFKPSCELWQRPKWHLIKLRGSWRLSPIVKDGKSEKYWLNAF